VSNIVSILTAVLTPSPMQKMCISSHAISKKCMGTKRFTSHSRTVDSKYGTCFRSPFWHLQFEGGFL